MKENSMMTSEGKWKPGLGDVMRGTTNIRAEGPTPGCPVSLEADTTVLTGRIRSIRASLQHVQELGFHLEKRLKPILGCETPCETNCVKAPEFIPSSELAGSLYEIDNEIGTIQRSIDNLLRRLDI